MPDRRGRWEVVLWGIVVCVGYKKRGETVDYKRGGGKKTEESKNSGRSYSRRKYPWFEKSYRNKSGKHLAGGDGDPHVVAHR